MSSKAILCYFTLSNIRLLTILLCLTPDNFTLQWVTILNTYIKPDFIHNLNLEQYNCRGFRFSWDEWDMDDRAKTQKKICLMAFLVISWQLAFI
jgi:hypothetical protein